MDGPQVAPHARARRHLAWLPLGAGVVAFLVYAATTARTITWWEGSDYPLAAATLGISPAPGSLLLTLVAAAAARVTLVRPLAFQLNLLAALIGALAAAATAAISARLAAREDGPPGAAEAAAGAMAGLVFALGPSMWANSVRLAPYGLTALFTALLLAVALGWWQRAAERDAPAWLFLLALLLGLDFSVHRTNLLLAPGLLAWVLLRRPGALLRPRPWAAALAGLALGLGFHLLLIPLSRRDPWLDLGEPRDLARWWDYVSLRMHGGGFLVDLFPRRADLVQVQLADYFHYLQVGLAPPGHWRALGLVSVALVVLGLASMLRRAPRRTVGLLALYLCASLGAVFYFNLTAHYFRVMDRHYLPSFVLVAPFVAAGATVMLRPVAGARGAAGRIAGAALAAVLALLTIGLGVTGWTKCDQSRVRFAETYSRDTLEPLAPHAILFTNGDNDTFPLWYLQRAEGVRPDVTVINVPLLNTGWYRAQLGRRDPDLAPLARRCPSDAGIATCDSIVTLAVAPGADSGLPAGEIPAAVTLHPGAAPYPQDRAVLELLRLVAWRRPIYLAITTEPGILDWLRPCARLEGMAYRVVPSTDPRAWDQARARDALLARVRFADLADRRVPIAPDSRPLLSNYVTALWQLASAQMEAGDAAGCLATLRLQEERAPLDRLGASELRPAIVSLRRAARAAVAR